MESVLVKLCILWQLRFDQNLCLKVSTVEHVVHISLVLPDATCRAGLPALIFTTDLPR